MDGRLRYFKRGKFTKGILVICALFVPYLLGLLSCKSVRVTSLADMSSEFDMINQIYNDAVKRSQEAFKRNGGIKDGSMISLGHGPKIRLWDYFGPNFNCVSKERVGKIGDGVGQKELVNNVLHDIQFHDIGLGGSNVPCSHKILLA
ncbi:unnamed protein product [Bathycoccus prasinos]